LKNGKALGYDLITAPFLKQLPPKTIIILSYIFNSMLRLSYLPSIWKHTEIILIHKPGKPPDIPSSYRPISLLPTLGKLFEKLLLKRLSKIASENKIISDLQFGLKKNTPLYINFTELLTTSHLHLKINNFVLLYSLTLLQRSIVFGTQGFYTS